MLQLKSNRQTKRNNFTSEAVYQIPKDNIIQKKLFHTDQMEMASPQCVLSDAL